MVTRKAYNNRPHVHLEYRVQNGFLSLWEGVILIMAISILAEKTTWYVLYGYH